MDDILNRAVTFFKEDADYSDPEDFEDLIDEVSLGDIRAQAHEPEMHPGEDSEDVQRDVGEILDVLTLGGKNIPTTKQKKGKKRPSIFSLLQGGTKTDLKLTQYEHRIFGEANALYISQDYIGAIEKCEFLIKRQPRVAEIYKLLALIYEENNDIEKALPFHMIGAHLSKDDADRWRDLASMALELGNQTQALYCLRAALQINPDDLELTLVTGRILEEMGKRSVATRCFKRYHRSHPNNVEIASRLAILYQEVYGKTDEAIACLETAMKSALPKDPNPVNLLCQLYLTKEYHQKVIRLLNDYRLFTNEAKMPLDLEIKYGIASLFIEGRRDFAEDSFRALDNLPQSELADIYKEIGDAYYALENYEKAIDYYAVAFKETGFKDDDVAFHKARSEQQISHFDDAKQTLTAFLAENPKHDEARIFLSEIYRDLQDYHMAYAILKEASLNRAQEQQDQGQLDAGTPGSAAYDQATGEIRTPANVDPYFLEFSYKEAVNAFKSYTIILQTCHASYQIGAYEDYLAHAQPLLTLVIATSLKKKREYTEDMQRYAQILNETNNQDLLSNNTQYNYRDRGDRDLDDDDDNDDDMDNDMDNDDDHGEALVGNNLDQELNKDQENLVMSGIGGENNIQGSIVAFNPTTRRKRVGPSLHRLYGSQAWNDFVLNGLFCFYKLKRYSPCITLIYFQLEELRRARALGSLVEKSVRKIAIVLGYLVGDMYMIYHHSKALHPLFHNTNIHLLGIIYESSSRCRLTGDVVKSYRRLSEHKGCKYRLLFLAHAYLASRFYRLALSKYIMAYHLNRDDPQIHLYIGIVFLQIAMQKGCTDRKKAILSGFAFLNGYLEKKNRNAESLYNIARAYHQLSINHLALAHYNQVLMYLPSDTAKEITNTIKFKRLAAYNASLIYKESGNTDLALSVLYTHCRL